MEECSQRTHQPSTVPGGNAEIDATVQEKAVHDPQNAFNYHPCTQEVFPEKETAAKRTWAQIPKAIKGL